MFSLAVGMCLELLGHVLTLCLTAAKTAPLFPKAALPLGFPAGSDGASDFSAPLSALVIVCRRL